jgi:hypothetical protein
MRFWISLSIASLMVSVAAAVAIAAPKGGKIEIFVTPGKTQGEGTIVVAGAIGDYGTTTKRSKSGIGEAVLHSGTFQVNLAAISKKLNNANPTLFNTKTCSYVFGATAPVKILNGTGLYKGISGTLMLTETFAGYGPFYASGAHKGKCNTSNNAVPLAQWGSVTGIGTVTFG